MSVDVYNTIEREAEAKVTEKMSRFLAFARHASSADEARAIVKDIQNKYHDARHVCWACMTGAERDDWQLNDNGEPSGTAGKPILGQINSRELTDVVVAVVRYFGGIKLGTSGLIQAYRQAASDALDAAGVREVWIRVEINITFPYVAADPVMRLAKGGGVRIVSQEFDNTCRLRISVEKRDVEAIMNRLEKMDGVVAEFVDD